MNVKLESSFFEKIKKLLLEAQQGVVKQVNSIMVSTYYEMGKQIVEQEQNGSEEAEYGSYILSELSQRLTSEFGKGYSKRNLELIRKFYLTYKNAKSPISQNLSWTHYIQLMRIGDEKERSYYQQQTEINHWSVRELDRQINSSLFQRIVFDEDNNKIKPPEDQGDSILNSPLQTIKDPYVLEFLNLEDRHSYSESQLEQAIIDKLENFLLELGKGFTFVGRQVRFTFDEEHFRIDLVFYNRLLRCFVLIDLKIGKLKHQDLGQMQMYVNYYDRFVKTQDEMPTIGIILCKDKKDTMVEITLPKDNKQIFASKYLLYLPKEEELKKLIQ
ncbi:PDDEXK nuclease domain-containing protein [Algoriphagus chordae]|uniref:Putative nuclease of restriction endonuclease-like (RecB) superfamily n=1 Tax=Algoriphagus chordae TaxID=237019 RepID=A0A2W7RU07_9BACT|nr:PDDEXK nuclease domain-containing protein [Algoriphagus chordae]PZX58109.1 putative nuclease of restriction endonuclease-like (RecB) superfamily [Algoriphagus chordae]